MARFTRHEQLVEFVRLVEKMRQNSLIRDGRLQKVKANFKLSKDGVILAIIDAAGAELDMERFDALCMNFRQTIMEKEAINVKAILKTLLACSPYNQREKIETAQLNWETALTSDSNLMKNDTEFFSLQEILDYQFYGGKFHTDKEKSEFVRLWGDLLTAEFVMIVHYLINWILQIGILAKTAIDDKWTTVIHDSSRP